jgi:hypothetical protein
MGKKLYTIITIRKTIVPLLFTPFQPFAKVTTGLGLATKSGLCM